MTFLINTIIKIYIINHHYTSQDDHLTKSLYHKSTLSLLKCTLFRVVQIYTELFTVIFILWRDTNNLDKLS